MSHRAVRGAAVAIAVVVVLGAERPAAAADAGARGPSSREEQERRRILEQLGLEKRESRPPAPPPPAERDQPAVPPVPPVGSTPGTAAAPAPPPGGAAAPPSGPPFAGRVHETLLASCRVCHAAGAPAGLTRLVLGGDRDRDWAAARKLVDLGSPRRSLLLTKAIGVQHGGGATLGAGSEGYKRILQWIAGGAISSLGARVAPPPAVSAAAPVARPAPASGRKSGAPVAPPAPVPVPVPVRAPADPLAAATPPTAASAQPATSAEDPAPPATIPAPAPPPAPMLPASATKLHAELRRACLPCHVRGAPAGATRYVLSGEPGADLAATRAFVDGTAAASSLVATKAAGREHGGGAPWPVGSAPHLALLAWIAEGAPAAPPAPAPAAAPVAVGAEAEAAAAAVAPVPTPPPLPAQPPPLAPLPPGHRAVPGLSVSFLSQTLSLNGRFDMNLERRGFRSNPFDDAGATAFQSYHHFLFLSRTSTEDPFTFTAEIVNLELYEIAARLGPRRGPFKINVRAGKVLVPFGNEPLFHQSYGGHAGFDQRVLPAIWAAEGAVASGSTRWRGLSASADLYAVKGYALRRADAVLNLKNDFSPLDDARVALGARVGLAWGPLSGFYSTYANRLGFGRLLFMQALDVGLWRWRGGVVPGLDRLVLGAGLLRADVSGGGAGQDYYHFASYWLARVYLFDWLHLQYRQGLRTFNNRRGVIGDSTRWDSDDGSTHNLTLTARVRGLQVALAYHLNFEKAGEIDDDLFRLAVAYEF